jgi:phage terminase large subunit-like protein
MVINEMEVFPKDRYDDLTDSTTQAIRYLRDNSLLRTGTSQGRSRFYPC